MPREIITIQVGQCGNQIGMKFWDLALREHASCGSLYDDSMSSFFRNDNPNSDIPILKARCLVVDTEEGVINQLMKSELSELFNNKHFIKGVSGAGNNWAHGNFEYGPYYKESILKQISSLLEECDSPQCFMFTHSIGGGTGSGLGTYIIKTLSEEYPELYRFSATVFPSEDDDVITSPYNSILSLNELIEYSDCVMPIDNQSLIDICNQVDKYSEKEQKTGKKILSSNIIETSKPKIISGKLVTKSDGKENSNEDKKIINQNISNIKKSKPYDKMNSLIANLLSNFTCSMRFEGSLNVDINDITMNLVPFPRLHFLSSSISPLYHVLDKSLEPRKSDQIFSDIFHKDYQLITMNNYYEGIYLASALIARGNLTISDINYNISRIKNKLKMVHWNHEGFKIGLCNQPPVNMSYGILCLSNNTAIGDSFSELHNRFNKLFRVKAHVHHYTEYMDIEYFANCDKNVSSLIEEYKDVGINKNKNFDLNIIKPIT